MDNDKIAIFAVVLTANNNRIMKEEKYVWVYVDYREEKGGEMRGPPGHKDNPLLLRHAPGEHGDKGGDPSLQIASPKILTFIKKNPTFLKKWGFFSLFSNRNRKPDYLYTDNNKRHERIRTEQ